jgi:hypothetical protein
LFFRLNFKPIFSIDGRIEVSGKDLNGSRILLFACFSDFIGVDIKSDSNVCLLADLNDIIGFGELLKLLIGELG